MLSHSPVSSSRSVKAAKGCAVSRRFTQAASAESTTPKPAASNGKPAGTRQPSPCAAACARNKAGTPWHAGHRGHLAIGRHPTGRNAANHGANGLGGRVASRRDGRKRLARRKRGRFTAYLCRAFGNSRCRTEAGARPFQRAFHASCSMRRELRLRWITMSMGAPQD